jgi:hypothetical protein
MLRDRPSPKLQVIQGGLPPEPEHEWTAAEILRRVMPSIKRLPFVTVKKDAKPQWNPENFWNVASTRSWSRDYKRGEQYAIAAVTAMRADGCNGLADIFRDMVDKVVEQERMARREKRRLPKRDVVVVGFLHQLGNMPEPNQDAELARELDEENLLSRKNHDSNAGIKVLRQAEIETRFRASVPSH